jgi:hypothetical protein
MWPQPLAHRVAALYGKGPLIFVDVNAAILNGLDLICDPQELARSDGRISKRPWEAT